MKFTGNWVVDDSVEGFPEPPDDVENLICVSFIVVDVVTVPSGEGAAGCFATKTVFRTVRQCFRQGFRKKCNLLKAAKEVACAASNGMGCGTPPSCRGLSGAECHLREMVHNGCANAREAYQKVCFTKGRSNPEWPGHIQAIRTAQQAARNCGACARVRP